MWNQFEPASNEDETLGDSYFTSGLLKISNEKESDKDPAILSSLNNKSIVIAVDKSLILLEDEATMDCKFVSFGAEINCFAFSKSANYIVCCLSDGSIHGIHVKGFPLFNTSIKEEDVSSRDSFVDIQLVDDEFYVLCHNGRIYKVKNIEEEQLDMSSLDTDATCVLNESVFKYVNAERVSHHRLTSRKITSFCVIKDVFYDIFIICCDNNVVIMEGDEVSHIKYAEECGPFKKVYNLQSFIIGLTFNGKLIEIDPYTKVLQKCATLKESNAIDDLKVLESNEEYIELLILSDATENERQMSVIDYPSLNIKSELTLPQHSYIVSQPKSSINMYFIVGYKNERNFLQSIELKSITEADPEQRFLKLILRGHFEEAESYAKSCDINLAPLHEARVKKTLAEISTLKSTEMIEQKFEQLLKQLEKIENQDYLVSLRLSHDISDRACLTRFFEFLLQSIDTNKYQEETNEINELLLRLETLRLIDPFDTNLQWRKFLYQKDMQKVAMEYFKMDVVLSCLVWSRHATSIIPNMNLKKFYGWLDGMRSSVEPFELIQFLRHFAPCFLQFYPDETSNLVDWCIGRTRSLQFSASWPEVGLEFINNIKNIFQEIEFLFVKNGRAHYNMEKILKVIYILEEMVVLKTKYHLILSFDDYSKNSVEEKALKLLQRIQMHNIKNLVNDFLYPIFMEHGMIPEETLVKYINFLAQNKNLGFWQERAVVVIDLLNNEENRLNSALLILKVSPVPWSDAVIPLAKLGTTSKHPIANLISIEHKNQAIKIIKIKYGWPVDYFDLQPDRLKLARRILKINNQDMIEDLKILVKSSPDIKEDAYYYLIQRLVEVGRMDELAQFAASISTESDSNEIYAKTIRIFMLELDEVDFPIPTIEAQNYIEASKMLLNYLKDNIDDYKFNRQKKLIEDMRYIVQYREEFHPEISLKEIQKSDGKKKWLNASVATVAKHISDTMSLDRMWNKVMLLANIFKESHLKLFTLICQQLNNVYVTCNIIDRLCHTEEIFRKERIQQAFELCTLMISQQIISLENNNYQLKQVYDPLAFPLAYELLLKCLAEYDLYCHESILELMHWISLIRCFYPRDVIEATRNERVIDDRVFVSKKVNGQAKHNGSRRESFSVFDNFEEKVNVDQPLQSEDVLSSVVECLCNAFKIVAVVLNSNLMLYTLFRQFNATHDWKLQVVKDDFSTSLENLLKLKRSMDVFTVMQMIIGHQQKMKVIVLPQQFVTTVNKKMLKYILSQKDPEYINAFIIFRSEPNKDDCISYLKQSLRNNSQRIALSTFSEMYNQYKKNDEFKIDRESRLKLYYYSEICKSYPTLRAGANLDNIGISEFLKDLEKRLLSVDLVKKLSKDFGWNYQRSLIKQVKIALRQQNLEFETKTDVFGNDEVIIKTTIESIKKQCQPYISEITDFATFAMELEQFFKEENSYFYELSLAILDFLENCKELSMHYKLYRNILLLLKHKLTFKRRSINAEEYEYWQKTQRTEGSILPAISSWRIPFKLFIEGLPESVLSKDLTVESFETYYPLIQLHSALLKGDDHFDPNERIEKCALSAVTNSVQDMRNQAEATVGLQYNLKPRNNAFLQTVKRMVGYLVNKGKALTCMYYIVTNTPNGSDQCEAAYECYKFATMYKDEILASKYADLYEKASRKYFLLKTQHLLHVFGMAEDSLLMLIENPRLLIHALYNHDSIIKGQKKEINMLCSELANLFNLDLSSIQIQLISTWMAFNEASIQEEGDGNETVYEDFMGGSADNGSECVSDESVVRTYYILDSWNNETALEFLADQMNSESGHNQLQIYECFSKLINESSTNYIELVNTKYLLIRICHLLKNLGYSIKIEKFEKMDKINLLKMIWTSHNNNPKALEAMVLICLGFNIHLPQIWNGILKQMVSHKMIKHLSMLVEILSTKTEFLHLTNLKLAWEFVIQNPLTLGTKIRNFEEDQKLTKALILLQKCPISTFLNVFEIAEKFMRLDRPDMAAICIAFSKEPERQKIINLLSNENKRELSKNIEYLEEFGVAPVITKTVTCALNL